MRQQSLERKKNITGEEPGQIIIKVRGVLGQERTRELFHKLSLGEKRFIFFQMPRDKQKGCGRRNGGEHTFVFKNRTETN